MANNDTISSTVVYLKEALLDMAGVTTSELGGAPPNRHFLKSLYDTCVGPAEGS